ncbi:hypothetical protein Godav_002691, partial [Gossypium davidsonii]|nr:hypothetical protein [Gossypium davidsonii]
MGHELNFWTNCLSKTQRKLVRVEGENQIEDWLMKAFGFWNEIKEVNNGLLVFGNYFLRTGTALFKPECLDLFYGLHYFVDLP